MTLPLILALVLSALQVADAVTTTLALRSGAVEKNPIIRHLMDQIGVVPALVVKVVLVSAAAIAAAVYYPTAILQVVFGLLIAVYLYIVVNNARLIK